MNALRIRRLDNISSDSKGSTAQGSGGGTGGAKTACESRCCWRSSHELIGYGPAPEWTMCLRGTKHGYGRISGIDNRGKEFATGPQPLYAHVAAPHPLTTISLSQPGMAPISFLVPVENKVEPKDTATHA